VGVKIQVGLDAPDDALRDYGAGALIRVERAAAEDGVYAEIGTVAIVAATFAYEYFDATGSTTHWYRWRVSNALNTVQSGYQSGLRGTDTGQESLPSSSYATLDEMLLTHRQSVTDTRVLNRYEKVLREVTRDLIREVGYDFFRHPQSGTETRTYHADGSNLLHVHEGIVELAGVEIRTETNGTWIPLDVGSWFLEAELDDLNPAPGEPYFHVRLSDVATYTTFPKLKSAVRLTLAWGWPAVPADAVEAAIAWARQRVGWDPTQPGGAAGPDDVRSGFGMDRMPDQVYRFLLQERRRHLECWT
jgi:hypothetical protein